MSASPSFQFFPQDFLVGTAEMLPEEVGAYIRLLCYQWSKGGLPEDHRKLASLAGCSRKIIGKVIEKFTRCEDGFYRNSRMELVRGEQEEYRKKQAAIARKGWEKRKGSQCEPNAKPLPTHDSGIALADATAEGSLCSSSSSSIVLPTIRAREGYPTKDEFVDFFLPGFVSDRAFPAEEYLCARWSDYDSTGWIKGTRPITNWKSLADSLQKDYRNDASKAKFGGDPNGKPRQEQLPMHMRFKQV